MNFLKTFNFFSGGFNNRRGGPMGGGQNMRGGRSFNGEQGKVEKLSPKTFFLSQFTGFSDRGGSSGRGSFNNDNNYRRNDGYDSQNMRGGRGNFNGELGKFAQTLQISSKILKIP